MVLCLSLSCQGQIQGLFGVSRHPPQVEPQTGNAGGILQGEKY